MTKGEGSSVARYGRKIYDGLYIFSSIFLQQKIAKFFSLLDKQIELWETKLKLNEQLKRYFIISLFYQLKMPNKLRFIGFDEKWVETKIKDIAHVVCGRTPSTKNELFWNGDIPFVTPTDISGKYQNTTERYITSSGIKETKLSKKGSIFVTCVASIGKNSICKIESSFNQQINNLYSNKYSNDFIYYLLSRSNTIIKSWASKSATEIITKSVFENIELWWLNSVSEQQKIAKFLSLFDIKINLIKTKIDKFNLIRKSCCDKLFV